MYYAGFFFIWSIQNLGYYDGMYNMGMFLVFDIFLSFSLAGCVRFDVGGSMALETGYRLMHGVTVHVC